MKKTLLSALNHGSGILLTLFSLLCACQVWASVTVTKGEVIRINTSDHAWFKDDDSSPRLYLLNSTSSDDGAVMVGEAGSYDSDNVYNITIDIDTDTKTGNFLEVRRYSVTKGENNKWQFYVSDRDAGYSSIYLNTSGTLEWERCFSTGDKFYLLNNASYRVGTDNQLWFQKGSNGKAWIHLWSNPSSGTYDAEFTLLSGEAETSGAIYQASVSGCYAHFLITRNSSESTGPFDNEWNRSGEYVVPPVNNRITGTTSGSYSSDFYLPCTEPTVITASSPAAKGATTATLTGTYTTEGVCVPTAKGVAYKEDGGAYSYLTDGTSASGSINISISDLTPLTTYYYKAYVELEGGKKLYGAEYNFTTDCRGGIVISTQPSSSAQDGCLGSATALSVTASGASDYTYQWYYNSTASVSGATAIPGATASSYTPAVVGTNYYYCSVGAAGGYCEVASNFSGAITIKGVPSLTATPSSVTNYAPVTITASGAEISSWNITSGTGGYLYKKSATSAKFKGNVGSSDTPVTYTIQGTVNGCSGTTTVTVNKNADSCE